ncbi:glycosyltransferase family 2 protein [Aeromonas hydrophila]
MMISVVIPAFNAENTIKNAIESVLGQTYKGDLEIIVVNDGSVDGTRNIVNDLMTKFKNIILLDKVNGGVSSARNFGIHAATGDWIAFLDADDIWLPDKLSAQWDIINSSSFNIDFVGCARNNEILSILGKKITCLHKASMMELLIKMFPQTSTALIKKELLIQVGCYDENMTHAEDGDLWLRLCNAGDFYYMPQSLVLTGGGKANYGESGLSGNLSAMHKGTIHTINKLYKNKQLSDIQALAFKCFYYIKYIRRIVIVSFRRFY